MNTLLERIEQSMEMARERFKEASTTKPMNKEHKKELRETIKKEKELFYRMQGILYKETENEEYTHPII